MRRLAALGLASLVLASCGLFRPKDEDRRACPRAAIVGELAELQRYREGPGRDLTDVAVSAQIAGIDGDCTLGRNEVEVTMKVAIVGDRGPGLQGDAAEVEYFVAITAPDETQPRAKQVFRTLLDFRGGRPRTGSSEELVEKIPLPGAREKGAAGWSILVGFQLTPEELEVNRRRRSGR
jgi:hypothetical protein